MNSSKRQRLSRLIAEYVEKYTGTVLESGDSFETAYQAILDTMEVMEASISMHKAARHLDPIAPRCTRCSSSDTEFIDDEYTMTECFTCGHESKPYNGAK